MYLDLLQPFGSKIQEILAGIVRRGRESSQMMQKLLYFIYKSVNNIQMGGQCSTATNLKDDFQLLNQITHPTFGNIQILKSNGRSFRREQIGMKQFTFPSIRQQQQYAMKVHEAREYENIPTLVKILLYQKKTISNTKALAECSTPFKINLYFKYYPKNLTSYLSQKRSMLNSQKKPVPNIKLNDYEKIDRLPHQQRKIISCFYQQVQILRMIDHIIGGLYFLNHFSYNHGSVSPNNILVDEEGKYILADSNIFKLQSNYMRSFNEYLGKKNQKQLDFQAISYLSPELLSNLKAKYASPKYSREKADIFNVGLMALEMCLLQTNIHCQMLDPHNIKINKTQLNKLLIKTKQKYSDELVDLLRFMLEYDPNKRINYSALIDLLNPLLTINIERVQKIYEGMGKNNSMSMELQDMKSMSRQGNGIQLKEAQIMRKLNQIQNKYKKVMNNKLVLENKEIDQKVIREDEKRILNELKKMGGYSRHRQKQIKGSQLYEIYLHEYESIKQSRPQI